MSHDLPIQLCPPPSRRVNPFATCWTRPGALSFRFSNGQSVEQLISQLAAQQWNGAIVGPHGSGKSTLLESLKRVIAAAGRTIQAISLRDGQRRLPRDFFATWASDSNAVVIIDGYEQLGWPARLHLSLRCFATGVGLLVTSHRPIRIPTLIRLAPDRQLIEQLVCRLCAEVSTTITRADIAASHACHGSNVREILFDLYDRHEQRRRESNSFLAVRNE
jgi:energy-coupling factor transporter ATP-binding protein EcfA2